MFRPLVKMYDSLSSLLQLGGLFQQLSHTDHTPQAVFTLSPAWISAPFLISTSMIWMLPQPAAIRRGGVPCCHTNTNLFRASHDQRVEPRIVVCCACTCCSPCWADWHRSCLRSRVNAWDRGRCRHLWHGWWPSSQRSLPHPRWVGNRTLRHLQEHLILSKIKFLLSHAL